MTDIEIKIAVIKELREDGLTFQEIGDLAHISRQRVHQILNNEAYRHSHHLKNSNWITACKVCSPNNTHDSTIKTLKKIKHLEIKVQFSSLKKMGRRNIWAKTHKNKVRPNFKTNSKWSND